MTPSETELKDAIYEASKKAISELFNKHPGNFYYFALITTGEAHPPFISAWSKETLKNAATTEEERNELKWSYADSPYCCYGEEYFFEVKELFSKRPEMSSDLSEDEWNAGYNVRLNAMEAAIANLDEEGIFGKGEIRNNIVINVEVMPPDSTNTERAKRLNPLKAIETWLFQAAE